MIRRKWRAERDVVAARTREANEALAQSQRVGARLEVLMQQLRDLNQSNNFAEKMRRAYET